MAGKNPGFNGAAFRKGIRFVYDMSAPPDSDEQATFFKASQLIYSSPTDSDDVPFSPTILPVSRQPSPPIKVPCAVEYRDGQGNITDFGMIVPAHARITLLDEDYLKVKGCAYVVLRGEKFNYTSTEMPSGLFDVGLYVMHFSAENAS